MEREVAEELMRTLVAMNEPLNAATVLTEKIKSKDEQDSLRRVIGTLMQTIYIELMRPIIRQYPDLDPDRTQNSPT